MSHPRIVDIVRAAAGAARTSESPPLCGEPGTVPVSAYTDVARLAAERTRLFRALPIPVAHASEVKNVAVRELDGVSILLVRGDDGAIRGLLNACRHRGVRL